MIRLHKSGRDRNLEKRGAYNSLRWREKMINENPEELHKFLKERKIVRVTAYKSP